MIGKVLAVPIQPTKGVYMPYKCIDIADSLTLLENDAQVVDIRDPASFHNGRITNAVHLSNDNLNDYIRNTDHDKEIIVCCYHGNSSKNAAEYLAAEGFNHVYSLNGGFSQWSTMYPDRCEQG